MTNGVLAVIARSEATWQSNKGRLLQEAQKGVAVFLVVSILSAYSVATLSRNLVWKDDYTLYTDMIKKSPDAALPRNLLGQSLSHAGWIDSAIIQYQIAISLDPNLVDAHNNLGNAFYKKGLLDDAIREYQIVLSLFPNHRDALNNLSVVYAIRESILSKKNSSQ